VLRRISSAAWAWRSNLSNGTTNAKIEFIHGIRGFLNAGIDTRICAENYYAEALRLEFGIGQCSFLKPGHIILAAIKHGT